MTKKEAIQAIIDYNTLHSQIDYRLPWRIKATEAYKFLDTLPENEYETTHLKIRKAIDDYNYPSDVITIVDLDEMF